MKHHVTQLGISLLLLTLGISACTDRHIAPVRAPSLLQQLPPQRLLAVNDIQFNNQPTTVLQMLVQDSSLYLTGRPFGFSKWDIGVDAENPHLTFAASTQIDRFFGKWVVDWFPSGALAVVGPYAIMSGTVGASIVDLSETGRPKEVRRYPDYQPQNDEVVSDAAYVWSALVSHPFLPVLYAFRQQDAVLTFLINGTQLKPVLKNSYSATGGSECCANGATVFGDKVFVAFRSKLVFFDMASSGQLENPKAFLALHAVNVASTPEHLYVQHEPSAGTFESTQYPRGIYVFDKSGNNVAFLDESPLAFAVSSDDRHLYGNMDDQSIRTFRILWQ